MPPATLPVFTVTLANPSSLQSERRGSSGTVNETVASQNGFAEAVNLSCLGLPGQSKLHVQSDGGDAAGKRIDPELVADHNDGDLAGDDEE